MKGTTAGALTLHDANGRLVWSFATVQPGQRISLAGLKAGVYFAALPGRDARTRLVVSY